MCMLNAMNYKTSSQKKNSFLLNNFYQHVHTYMLFILLLPCRHIPQMSQTNYPLFFILVLFGQKQLSKPSIASDAYDFFLLFFYYILHCWRFYSFFCLLFIYSNFFLLYFLCVLLFLSFSLLAIFLFNTIQR